MQQAFLTRPQVKQRYSISEMTLWRWENSETLEFPKPIVVNRRKFFREEDLTNWERARVKVSA
ncbi:unnamed protein product [Ciceribacter sp. T2.26MG-112.2]|uniref:helix-turn-helix transcriptional regulator n=1 Tax=Ciceribacter sp. T2.26MG-112.2 TaxID=3137154 RepID=UPI000E12C3C8|nr:AlpA family phage regulatory protein [Ciceribacter naphthalenivorans]SSC73058.1 unnamed protein product [Ciceribacter naphthalenivorans]